MENGETAIIESTFFGFEDHGCLTFSLHIEQNHSYQGMGGYSIGVGHRSRAKVEDIVGSKCGTEAMARIMWAVGVNSWEELKGKYCRIKRETNSWNAPITSIGHIVDDKWFNLQKYMEDYSKNNN